MYPAYNAEIPEGFERLPNPLKLFDSESVATNQKNWIDSGTQAQNKGIERQG